LLINQVSPFLYLIGNQQLSRLLTIDQLPWTAVYNLVGLTYFKSFS